MARPNPLADPEFAQQVAEAVAEGLSRQEVADLFNVKDVNTITRWRRDPRVATRAMKIIQDRVLQVTRKTDSIIAQRLQNAGDLTVKELLDIRKEFLAGTVRARTEDIDDGTIVGAMEALESNPNLLEELEKLLRSNHSAVTGGEKVGA